MLLLLIRGLKIYLPLVLSVPLISVIQGDFNAVDVRYLSNLKSNRILLDRKRGLRLLLRP